MDKHNIVFLVHGMGEYSPTRRHMAPRTGWMAEPKKALSRVGEQFSAIRQHGLTNLVEFVPITYDQVFHQRAANQKNQLDLLMDVLGGNFGVIEDWLGRQSTGTLNFFWTHVCDVLLYRFSSEIRDSVHVRFMNIFTEAIEKAWDQYGFGSVRFHTMAHSLGTAVTNGALTRLATVDHADRSEYRLGVFKALANHFAVANVSRALWADDSGSFYDDVALRPDVDGRPGYADYFLNVRHRADPFVAPSRFSPRCWGERRYREIVVQHVHQPNVHDWGHHLEHPLVAIPILRRLLGNEFIDAREAVEVRRNWSDFPVSLGEAQRDRLRDAVEAIGNNLRTSFGDDGDLVGDTLRAIITSVDEFVAASRALAEVSD